MSDDLRFDVRTLAHRKRRGELTQAEIDAWLASLPDDAEHGEPTETRFEAKWAARRSGERTSSE